jgi:hypothetical protein
VILFDDADPTARLTQNAAVISTGTQGRALMATIRVFDTNVTWLLLDEADPVQGYDHDAAIPGDPWSSPYPTYASFFAFGILDGKPTFQVRDGRSVEYLSGPYAGTRISQTDGVTITVQGPSLAADGLTDCHHLAIKYKWNNASGEALYGPSEVVIYIDGSIVQTTTLPTLTGNGFGTFPNIGAVYHDNRYWTIGASRDASYAPRSGNLAVEQLNYFVYGGSGDLADADVAAWALGSGPTPGYGWLFTDPSDLNCWPLADPTDLALTASGSLATYASCFSAGTPGGTPGGTPDDQPPVIPFQNCPPCPADTPGTVPNPVGPLPPWQALCVGGGLVDSVADLPDGEDWAA